MSSVRIWHDWLIAGAQKPHASLSVYRWQLHYTPISPMRRWWQVAPHGRSDGAQGAVRRSARDAHLCIVCATPFGSRPFS